MPKQTKKQKEFLKNIWETDREYTKWAHQREIVQDLESFSIAELIPSINKESPEESLNNEDTYSERWGSTLQDVCEPSALSLDPLLSNEILNNQCLAYRNLIPVKSFPKPSELLDPNEWDFAQWDDSHFLHFISKDKQEMVLFTGDYEGEAPNILHRLWGTKKLEQRVTQFLEKLCNLTEIRYNTNNEVKFNLIMRNQRGFYLQESSEFSFRHIDYDLHYNDTIHDFNEQMEKWKSWTEPNNRLCILRGEKGTGKTNWIRNYLQNWDGEIIFVPPSIAPHMTDPDFLPFISEHKGALLWLEDAEQIMEDRKNTKDLSVSNILNLTDGVMVDHLDFKIIMTHNQHADFIDEALRRGNRCWAEYEFGKLSEERTRALCEELELESTSSRMTISEIFALQNAWESDNEQEAKFGFNQ